MAELFVDLGENSAQFDNLEEGKKVEQEDRIVIIGWRLCGAPILRTAILNPAKSIDFIPVSVPGMVLNLGDSSPVIFQPNM